MFLFVNVNTETSTDAFQLKESMDLYEEIVTEEQQNRESTYLEVKTMCSALFFFVIIIIIIITTSSSVSYTGSSNVITVIVVVP